MKNTFIIAVTILAGLFTSCTDHEVIKPIDPDVNYDTADYFYTSRGKFYDYYTVYRYLRSDTTIDRINIYLATGRNAINYSEMANRLWDCIENIQEEYNKAYRVIYRVKPTNDTVWRFTTEKHLPLIEMPNKWNTDQVSIHFVPYTDTINPNSEISPLQVLHVNRLLQVSKQPLKNFLSDYKKAHFTDEGVSKR